MWRNPPTCNIIYILQAYFKNVLLCTVVKRIKHISSTNTNKVCTYITYSKKSSKHFDWHAFHSAYVSINACQNTLQHAYLHCTTRCMVKFIFTCTPTCACILEGEPEHSLSIPASSYLMSNIVEWLKFILCT